MQNQLLLLSDVDNVGRSGDLVTVRPGFARNFLLPQKKAVVADKYTLKLQAQLKEERDQQSKSEDDGTIVRVLKNRFTGWCGPAGSVKYEGSTGRMLEFKNSGTSRSAEFNDPFETDF
jgi:hypothetical protein